MTNYERIAWMVMGWALVTLAEWAWEVGREHKRQREAIRKVVRRVMEWRVMEWRGPHEEALRRSTDTGTRNEAAE